MKPRHNDDVIAERDRQIWYLRNRGKTQQQIALIVGLNHSTISDILARFEAQFRIEFVAHAEKEKERQTSVLIQLFDVVYDEWEKSQGEAVLPDDLTGEDVGGDVLAPFRSGRPARSLGSGSTQTRQMFGDPRYIDQLRGILKDIRGVWGLEAPKQVDANIQGNFVVAINVLPSLPDDEDMGADK